MSSSESTKGIGMQFSLAAGELAQSMLKLERLFAFHK